MCGNINLKIMSVITSTEQMSFRKSQPLFDRIKKRLLSYDSNNAFDSGDFFKHVKFCLEKLGDSVMRECEAFIHIPVQGQSIQLPLNYKQYHAAWSCNSVQGGSVKSIDEQPAFVIYNQTTIINNVKDTCHVTCCDEGNVQKVIVQQVIEGTNSTCNYNCNQLFNLVGNLQSYCNDQTGQGNTFCQSSIAINKDNNTLITNFSGDIYLQYLGLPLDEDKLPMIPDVEDLEKFIEYFILKQIFEDFYFANIPNVVSILQYINREYDIYKGEAEKYVKTPSFQRAIKSIYEKRRRDRAFNPMFDKTIIN